MYAYPYYPSMDKAIEKHNDLGLMRNKQNIESVQFWANKNNFKRSKLIKTKNVTIKNMMKSNIDIPEKWVTRPDYKKFVYKVLEDRNLEEYMRRSYPNQEIIELNMNLPNKDYKIMHTTPPEVLPHFKFANTQIPPLPKPDISFLQMIKTQDSTGYYLQNKEIFSESKKQLSKDREEELKNIILGITPDSQLVTDMDKDGFEFLKREKDRKNNRRIDADITAAVELIKLGNEVKNQKVDREEEKTKHLFGIINYEDKSETKPGRRSPRSRTRYKSVFKSSPIKKNNENDSNHQVTSKEIIISLKNFNLEDNKSTINIVEERDFGGNSFDLFDSKIILKTDSRQDLQKASLTPKKTSNIISNFEDRRTSYKRDSIKTELLTENLSLADGSPDEAVKKNKEEKLKLKNLNFAFQKTKRLNQFNLMSRCINTSTSQLEFKYNQTDKNLFYGQEDLSKASTFNKIQKFEKFPKITNTKIRDLIYDIKESTSYGPYLSVCNSCNIKNINFYNTSDSESAITILKMIKNSHIQRKDLFGDIK